MSATAGRRSSSARRIPIAAPTPDRRSRSRTPTARPSWIWPTTGSIPRTCSWRAAPTRALDLEAEEDEKEKQKDDRRDKDDKEKDRSRVRRRTEPVRNHLEVFGIPPTLSVLLRRVEDDARKVCFEGQDVEGLNGLPATVTYQNNKAARREFDEAAADAAWFAGRIVDGGSGDAAAPSAQETARLARHQRGQARVRAIKAAQARLACEGLLTSAASTRRACSICRPTRRWPSGSARTTSSAGASWATRRWLALQRPPLELHFETWKRILTERVADAAGIIEDGTAPGTRKQPASYKDAAGKAHPVPNLLGRPPGGAAGRAGGHHPRGRWPLFLRAMAARACAACRWPSPRRRCRRTTAAGRPWTWRWRSIAATSGTTSPSTRRASRVEQKRERYPHLTAAGALERAAHPAGPLAHHHRVVAERAGRRRRASTTSTRTPTSGPRIWKQVVAAPVWVPPDSTPGQGSADQEGVRPAAWARSTW